MISNKINLCRYILTHNTKAVYINTIHPAFIQFGAITWKPLVTSQRDQSNTFFPCRFVKTIIFKQSRVVPTYNNVVTHSPTMSIWPTWPICHRTMVPAINHDWVFNEVIKFRNICKVWFKGASIWFIYVFLDLLHDLNAIGRISCKSESREFITSLFVSWFNFVTFTSLLYVY